jgi:hypothetical protein
MRRKLRFFRRKGSEGDSTKDHLPKAKDYSIWGMKDTKNRENPLFFLGGGDFYLIKQ